VADPRRGQIEQNGVATRVLANLADDLYLGPDGGSRAGDPRHHPGGAQPSVGQSGQRAPNDDDHPERLAVLPSVNETFIQGKVDGKEPVVRSAGSGLSTS
jgi:hypothetical protein